MAFCISCGNRLDDGTKFCTTCGAKQELPEEVVEQPAATVEESAIQTEQVHTEADMQEMVPEQTVELTPKIPIAPVNVQQIPPVPPIPVVSSVQQAPTMQPVQKAPQQPYPVQPMMQQAPQQPHPAQPMMQQAPQQPYPVRPMQQQPVQSYEAQPYPGQPYQAAAMPGMEEKPMPGSKYAVAGTFSYFGMLFLFCIPFIGFIACLIMSFAMKNENLKRFSRAVLIWYIIGIVLSIVFMIILFLLGASVWESFQGSYQDMFDSLNFSSYY